MVINDKGEQFFFSMNLGKPAPPISIEEMLDVSRISQLFLYKSLSSAKVDVEYELRLSKKTIKNLERDLKVYNQKLNCAQDKVVGAVSFHSDESFNKVTAFGCYQCEYSIWDDDVCDVFVNEILDQEQIEIMQDPETPDASASLGIDFLM